MTDLEVPFDEDDIQEAQEEPENIVLLEENGKRKKKIALEPKVPRGAVYGGFPYNLMRSLYYNSRNSKAMPSDLRLLGDRETIEIAMSLANLTPNERRIIRLTYMENMTLEEAGECCGGVTRERIRQVQKNACSKLRQRSTTKELLQKGLRIWLLDEIGKAAERRIQKATEEIRDEYEQRFQIWLADAVDSGIIHTPGDEEPLERGAEKEVLPIDVLGLSVRSFRCLTRNGINTIEKLQAVLAQPRSVLLSMRNLGVKSAQEIEDAMIQEGYWDGKRNGTYAAD